MLQAIQRMMLTGQASAFGASLRAKRNQVGAVPQQALDLVVGKKDLPGA